MSKLEKPVFAVLGAGNGGMAFAGHLGLMGFEVHLYNRSPERLQAVQQTGSIQLVSEDELLPTGEGPIACASSNMAEIVPNADIVMVVTPATAHAYIAEQCAPYLRSGHVVILHPGRTGGALEFKAVISRLGTPEDVVVAEAQTLLYACRLTNPAQVRIFAMKHSVPLAALPAYRTPEVIAAIHRAFPQFVAGDNVMKTSMDNIGAVFHPAVVVLNCSRIETTRGDFEFYVDGISRAAAEVLEQIDKERIAVGAALGFNCMSARNWLYVAYGAAGASLFDAIRANQGYYGIKAPPLLATRYLIEDVPMSLVPIASLGDLLGVECPTIKAVIHLAGLMTGTDYWAIGRTARSMGLAGLSVKQIRLLVLEGAPERPPAPSRGKRRSAKG